MVTLDPHRRAFMRSALRRAAYTDRDAAHGRARQTRGRRCGARRLRSSQHQECGRFNRSASPRSSGRLAFSPLLERYTAYDVRDCAVPSWRAPIPGALGAELPLLPLSEHGTLRALLPESKHKELTCWFSPDVSTRRSSSPERCASRCSPSRRIASARRRSATADHGRSRGSSSAKALPPNQLLPPPLPPRGVRQRACGSGFPDAEELKRR